jgi:hypothetical protein
LKGGRAVQQGGETLFIIGNGFDLQCGLKSSYSDFFTWLEQDEQRANDNFWAVHFLNSRPSGKLWVDVENGLQEVLKGSLLNHWASLAFKYYDDLQKGVAPYQRYEEVAYITEKIKYNRKGTKRFLSFSSYWFLDELRAFECQFCEYLQQELANNNEYLNNAAAIINMISDDKKMNILNFNYTNPFAFDSYIFKKNNLSNVVAQIANVHGTCDKNNIIFGVDRTEELQTDRYIFTKTYRKMMQGSPDRSLPPYVTKIKFYGHSLGKADYSYFQSIFDNYNLYGGDLSSGPLTKEQVVLEFYYTVFDEDRETKIVRDATDSVYRLITAYGATIDNKDKGKNLLHKLLLEGRVHIEFLQPLKQIATSYSIKRY